MLFLHCSGFLWSTPGLPGLLVARAASCDQSVRTNFNLPWLVGILGLVFIPWTSLMYVMIFPLNGYDWIWLGFGVMADIFSYVGGYHKRQQIPGYPSNDPLQNY